MNNNDKSIIGNETKFKFKEFLIKDIKTKIPSIIESIYFFCNFYKNSKISKKTNFEENIY